MSTLKAINFHLELFDLKKWTFSKKSVVCLARLANVVQIVESRLQQEDLLSRLICLNFRVNSHRSEDSLLDRKSINETTYDLDLLLGVSLRNVAET